MKAAHSSNFLCIIILQPISGKKGVFVIELSPQGPAMKAGVQNNDRLIEINGTNVENDTHEEVVEKVYLYDSPFFLFSD